MYLFKNRPLSISWMMFMLGSERHSIVRRKTTHPKKFNEPKGA